MEPPQVVLPDDQLFSRRARLRELMVMVPALDEFLDFMARLAQAASGPEWARTVLASGAGCLRSALAHRMPPLGFRALRRDLDWQGDLRAILDALALRR